MRCVTVDVEDAGVVAPELTREVPGAEQTDQLAVVCLDDEACSTAVADAGNGRIQREAALRYLTRKLVVRLGVAGHGERLIGDVPRVVGVLVVELIAHRRLRWP